MPRFLGVCLAAGLASAGPAHAQTAAQMLSVQQPTVAAQAASSPLTLEAALAQARANAQQFLSAQNAAALATEDRKQAFGTLLPSLSGFTQFIGTQANGTPSGVFVANDGPKVYNMWLTVHGDVFAPGRWAEYRAATAAAAVARAKAEVASRGLVSTVVQNFYTAVAAARKLASAQQGLREAQEFLDITQKQEAGGEVAHSDVVKAQIQVQQRQRDAQEAELNALKARLGLSVLIFPDYRDQFDIADDLQAVMPLPALDTVKTAALGTNPDVRAAEAGLQQATSGIGVARGGLLPSVSFDYFYGIDANQFAIYNLEGKRLLGSVFQAQMTVPLWTWGATQSKLRQAQLRESQAKVELSLAQRQLQANVSAFYREAQIAGDQVGSLRQSLDLSAESLRLTLLRYRSGEVSVLEVVDAQSTLIQARNAYDDGLVRYRVALAALQTVTGTL
ncbi:MAG TPA: TolC family protein [Vicinamibacterales bacterium]|nr:TolC family protein [Vicinamibacterales bacterium]